MMPAGAIAYVGWNHVVSDDQVPAKLVLQWLRAATGVDESDPRLRALRRAVDAVTLALRSPGGFALLDAGFEDGVFQLQTGVIVAAGEQSRTLEDAVRDAIEAMSPGRIHVLGEGAPFRFSTPIGDSPLRLRWGEKQGCFVMAVGTADREAFVQRIAPPEAECLKANRVFMLARSRTAPQPPRRRAELFIDAQAAIATGLAIATDAGAVFPERCREVCDALGVTDGFRGLYLHDGADERGSMQRAFVEIAGFDRPLTSLFQQSALVENDLRGIPRDATWALVWNVSLDKLWTTTVDALADAAPEAMSQLTAFVSAGQALLGFSIPDDLLPALGDTWALYDAPGHGGALLSGTILAVEVRDRDAMGEMLSRIVQSLPSLARGIVPGAAPAVKSAQFGPYTVCYLALRGTMSPVAPAWGFSGDRLLIGLTPQSVASAMRQWDPAVRGPSLLDHDEFRAVRSSIGGNAMSLWYSDTRSLAQALYPIALHYATALSNASATETSDVDLAAFPPLGDAVADVRPIIGAALSQEDGVLYVQSGSGPTLVGVAAVGALLSGVILPAMEMGREAAVQAAEAARLTRVGEAIAAYRGDHGGRWPPSFESLVEQGLLDREILGTASDALRAGSLVLVPGVGAARSPAEALIAAYREPGDENSTHVLLTDASVRRVSAAEFRRMLDRTLAALRAGEARAPSNRPAKRHRRGNR